MRTGLLHSLAKLPLVVEPETSGEQRYRCPDLAQWMRANASWIDTQLVAHGALLLRGFPITSAQDFESLAATVSPEFCDYVGGLSPRKHVAGNISTSTEAPSFLPIPLHCEMAYLDRYPSTIMFWCDTPPRRGGQTPIADMAAICNTIDRGIRDRMEERGLLLLQNLPGKRSLLTPRTWQQMFGMDRDGVDAFCVAHGIDNQWLPDESLRMLSRRPATIVHPRSGARIWFNAVTMHDSYSWELRRAGQNVLAAILERSERRGERRQDAQRRSHCTFADGTAIATSDIEHIRECYWNHAVMFDWQPGDMMIIDNLRVAHGRMPFKGARRILAALGAATRVPPATTPRAAQPAS